MALRRTTATEEKPQHELNRLNGELRLRIAELEDENAILRAQLAGHPDARWRWMHKATRQRAALDILNRKVISQRFRLRLTEQLREPITREEYLAARDAIGDKQLQARIEDPAA